MLFVFLLLITNTPAYSIPLTGPEMINPGMQEISRCIPVTMQAQVRDSIKRLPEAAKIIKALYATVAGPFSRNCKKLAQYLKELEIEDLLNEENITCHFNKGDRKVIIAMIKDKNDGLKDLLYILENLDLHFLGYVSILHTMFNKNPKLNIIDLIHAVDLVQRSALEIQEKLQLLSYLDFAKENIEGYEIILEGLRHQFSFKIMLMINTLNTITEDLRATYLSLLDKGTCSGDQVSQALGIRFKRAEAIRNED